MRQTLELYSCFATFLERFQIICFHWALFTAQSCVFGACSRHVCLGHWTMTTNLGQTSPEYSVRWWWPTCTSFRNSTPFSDALQPSTECRLSTAGILLMMSGLPIRHVVTVLVALSQFQPSTSTWAGGDRKSTCDVFTIAHSEQSATSITSSDSTSYGRRRALRTFTK